MLPSSRSFSPSVLILSHPGRTSDTWFLLLLLSLSPKPEAESLMQIVQGEQRWRERGHKHVEVVVSFPSKWQRAVTDLHLIQTCDRFTDVWVQWQKDSLKWNQCRNKRLHCLSTTVFWGCLCYLYLPPSASPLHHYYRHINVFFFPHSLFIAAPGAFVFTGYFTIFLLAQASSFLVYFYIEFLLKAVRDVASRQTGNVLLPSVMVLLLPKPICYIPQLTCFHCSAPNSLDMLLLQEKVLI